MIYANLFAQFGYFLYLCSRFLIVNNHVIAMWNSGPAECGQKYPL